MRQAEHFPILLSCRQAEADEVGSDKRSDYCVLRATSGATNSYLRQGSLPERPRPLGLGALALEPGCRHVRCHHKNEAIVKKGQNNINVLGANE